MITTQAEIYDALTIPGAHIRRFTNGKGKIDLLANPTRFFLMIQVANEAIQPMLRDGKLGSRVEFPQPMKGAVVYIQCVGCKKEDPGEGWVLDEELGALICSRCASWRRESMERHG